MGIYHQLAGITSGLPTLDLSRQGAMTLAHMLVLTSFAIAQQSFNESHSALQLLNQAEELSRSFSASERVDSLIDAAEIACRVEPKTAKTWAEEAFALTKKLPMGQFRAAMQKNALRILASADPADALRQYRQQDLPSQWLKPDQMVEDPRALSDPSIFSVIWSSQDGKSLRELISLAQYLGTTGQYPYHAMGEIAVDITSNDPRHVRAIVGDAIRAFQHDAGFSSTNSQFALFILRVRGSVNRRLLKKAVELAVDGIQHPHIATRTRATYRLIVTTPLGNAEFNSEREYLLFRLLPFAKRVAPRLAEDLMQQYPALKRAPAITEETLVQQAGAISESGSASNERMRAALDASLVFHVSRTGEHDSVQAIQLADQISDPILKALAFVLIAPYEKNKSNATNWLEAGKKDLNSLPNKLTKLQLMTAIIKSEIRMDEMADADRMLADALSLGEQLYETDRHEHPDEPSYLISGGDNLAQLAYAAAEIRGGRVAMVIDRVSDLMLRVRLLISAARAIAGLPDRRYLPV
jgi:hypothetical protein